MAISLRLYLGGYQLEFMCMLCFAEFAEGVDGVDEAKKESRRSTQARIGLLRSGLDAGMAGDLSGRCKSGALWEYAGVCRRGIVCRHLTNRGNCQEDHRAGGRPTAAAIYRYTRPLKCSSTSPTTPAPSQADRH